MTIRFGANPIIWSNDDLRELGADIPLETCLGQARQIGFEGMTTRRCPLSRKLWCTSSQPSSSKASANPMRTRKMLASGGHLRARRPSVAVRR